MELQTPTPTQSIQKSLRSEAKLNFTPQTCSSNMCCHQSNSQSFQLLRPQTLQSCLDSFSTSNTSAKSANAPGHLQDVLTVYTPHSQPVIPTPSCPKLLPSREGKAFSMIQIMSGFSSELPRAPHMRQDSALCPPMT